MLAFLMLGYKYWGKGELLIPLPELLSCLSNHFPDGCGCVNIQVKV